MSTAQQTQTSYHPISYRSIDGLNSLMDQVNDRIRRKAFEYYVERGAIDGRDMDDWLRAERALVQRPDSGVSRVNDSFVIEIDLPETNPEDILLFVGPHEICAATNPDRQGTQVLRVIQLPEPIETHNVEAELADGNLRITATISQSDAR